MAVKIYFKGTLAFPEYHDLPKSWKDGDSRTVSDERADYLTKTFPDHFVIAEEMKRREAKAKAEEEAEAKAATPDANKAEGAPESNK